mmetsp:Transcript_74614/g.241245  ORF Transcript_74614/g.241245 Transcript_74614/m.241245 type:complete len:288 (-) Transcript_74614:63-926(-)
MSWIGTTVARPRRRACNCRRSKASLFSSSSLANSDAFSADTPTSRPPSMSSTSSPVTSGYANCRPPMAARAPSSGRASPLRIARCFSAKTSMERTSSRLRSSPTMPFQVNGARVRGNRSPVRRASPRSWPTNSSARTHSGAVARGFSSQASRLSPTSATALGHGTKSGTALECSSCATASRASRYRPPASTPPSPLNCTFMHRSCQGLRKSFGPPDCLRNSAMNCPMRLRRNSQSTRPLSRSVRAALRFSVMLGVLPSYFVLCSTCWNCENFRWPSSRGFTCASSRP